MISEHSGVGFNDSDVNKALQQRSFKKSCEHFRTTERETENPYLSSHRRLDFLRPLRFQSGVKRRLRSCSTRLQSTFVTGGGSPCLSHTAVGTHNALNSGSRANQRKTLPSTAKKKNSKSVFNRLKVVFPCELLDLIF